MGLFVRKIKKVLYKTLSCENYLRVLQQSYFLLYRIRFLKSDSQFKWHYFVKKLIHEGDIILDIGANLGYYSILFARWTGTSGKVLSVEPISIYNKIFLEKAKKYKNIMLYPYALGSEEKTEVDFVLTVKDGYLRTGLSHIYDAEKDELVDQQEIKVAAQMKMASVLFKDLKRLDYIKCDIEGYEYIVLSDMEGIICKHRPIIQVELNRVEIFLFLDKLGYQAFKLHKKQLIKTTPDESLKGDYIFIPHHRK